jgi:hypothetical protein
MFFRESEENHALERLRWLVTTMPATHSRLHFTYSRLIYAKTSLRLRHSPLGIHKSVTCMVFREIQESRELDRLSWLVWKSRQCLPHIPGCKNIHSLTGPAEEPPRRKPVSDFDTHAVTAWAPLIRDLHGFQVDSGKSCARAPQLVGLEVTTMPATHSRLQKHPFPNCPR